MPEYKPHHRRHNCIKLLVGIHEIELAMQFNMRFYAGASTGLEMFPGSVKDECGTSACLLGHGPVCGIKPIGDERKDWSEYAKKFVENDWPAADNIDWKFLFGQEWSNDIDQAKARLFHHLTVGSATDDFDYEDEYPVPTHGAVMRLKKELS